MNSIWTVYEQYMNNIPAEADRFVNADAVEKRATSRRRPHGGPAREHELEELVRCKEEHHSSANVRAYARHQLTERIQLSTYEISLEQPK